MNDTMEPTIHHSALEPILMELSREQLTNLLLGTERLDPIVRDMIVDELEDEDRD
jgi:hypothetical protein